jgi:hypothetical protein
MTLLPAVALLVLVWQAPQPPVVPPDFTDFRAALDRYVELRHDLMATLPPRRVTDSAAEMLAWERQLTIAVRKARAQARQGEIFTPAVGAAISAIVAADTTKRGAEAREALMSDVALAVPVVNEPYPPEAPLGTFPALLIDALPPLPDDLEYRFMGRYLIIRDEATNLVVDYLLELTPARPAR